MVVEDLDDLGLIDAGHALRLLGVVDEDHAPAHRGDQIRAGQQPDRALQVVDDDRGAVVRVLDLLGDLADQLVGGGDDLVVLHQLAARGRERDHPRGDVGVERRGDHRCALLLRQLEHSGVGRAPFEITSSAMSRSRTCRCALARSPTTTTSLCVDPGLGLEREAWTQIRPVSARSSPVSSSPSSTSDDGVHVGRLAQRRARARLAHVAARERPGRDDADEGALVAHHGNEVVIGVVDREPRLADRVGSRDRRELGLHQVARAQPDVRQELRLLQRRPARAPSASAG